MRYDTIREAAEAWVREFDAYPQWMIGKIAGEGLENLYEITPPSRGDRVYIFDDNEYGEIVGINEDGDEDEDRDEDGDYKIELDSGDTVFRDKSDFEITDQEGFLPMWGTMWSFHDSCDYEYYFGEHLGGNHLQEMADCGFRIYEYSDRDGNEETFFGIDGAGYDFYESHWIPLYKKRGLKWHEEESENEAK